MNIGSTLSPDIARVSVVRLQQYSFRTCFNLSNTRLDLLTLGTRSVSPCHRLAHHCLPSTQTTKAGLRTYGAPGLKFHVSSFDKTCFKKPLASTAGRCIFLTISQNDNCIIKCVSA